ncbi:MAG: HAMP domain-containing histidine kinase [Deltaproteobacteria bacterium]|nr:HAMP domain-containing histidine kinase [Deltaproteobacteria bacterium]
MKEQTIHHFLPFVAFFSIFSWLALFNPILAETSIPQIKISSVSEPADDKDYRVIKGEVYVEQPSNFVIVVYIKIDDTWHPKPYTNKWETRIDQGTNWACTIFGAYDKVTTIIAFLVPKKNIPKEKPLPHLPEEKIFPATFFKMVADIKDIEDIAWFYPIQNSKMKALENINAGFKAHIFYFFILVVLLLGVISILVRSFIFNRKEIDRLRNQIDKEHKHSNKEHERIEEARFLIHTVQDHSMSILKSLLKKPENFERNYIQEFVQKISCHSHTAFWFLLPELDCQRMPIDSFMNNCIEEFQKLHAISIKTCIEDNLPEVMIDKKKFRLALDNLVTNSVQAIENISSNGNIRMNISQQHDNIEIKIWNNGGIEKKKLLIIQKELNNGTRSHEGIRLGLFIANEIIKKHPGELYFNSQEGEWTEVTITIPHI